MCRALSCVSIVIGSIVQTARIWDSTSRISLNGIRSFRDATATNSFRTWTLMAPPREMSSSALSAFAISADSR
jgi:hypothetical protein